MGLVFSGMETFFLRAEALGAEQRALWGGRTRPGTGQSRGNGGHGRPGQGTKGGGMGLMGRMGGNGRRWRRQECRRGARGEWIGD